MTNEDLLKVRYKQIANFPSCHNKEGYVHIAEDEIDIEFFEKYPAIYKKLEWFEERRPEDMPEYVKIGGSVYKVVDYSDYKGGTFYTRSTNRISRASYPLKNSTPSTKEEYEVYFH